MLATRMRQAAAGGAVAPIAPVNFTATAFSASQVNLAWDASAGATGYRVYRATNGVDFSQIQDQAGLTYSNTGLSGVLTFTYYVIAYNGAGDSPQSGTAAVAYYQRILALGDVIALWRQNETSGTVADNAEGTAARDGTYSGVDLNNALFTNGDPVPLFDGNDYINIDTTSLEAAFGGNEFTILGWFKVFNAGVWTDSTNRAVIKLLGNASNRVFLGRTTVNGRFYCYRSGGGVTKEHISEGNSSTDWMHFALIVSDADDEQILLLNATQVGATQIGIGTWATTAFSPALIGAETTTTNRWNGWLSHLAIVNRPLTVSEVTALTPF